MSVLPRWLPAFLVSLLMSGCGGDADPGTAGGDGTTNIQEAPSRNELLARARSIVEGGEGTQLEQAVAACDQVLAQQADDLEALLLRAQAYLGLARTDEALEDAEAAKRAGAQEKVLTPLRARIAVAAQRFADAEREFTEAISLDPADAALYEGRALARGVLEQHDAAIADFTEGLKHDPQSASLYRWRAEEYFSQGRLDDALRDANNAVTLDPENPEYYLARAHFRAGSGRGEDALADYQRAIELEPAPFSFYLRGNVHASLGDVESALADLSRAIEQEPDRVEYYLARANAHLQQEDLERAKADYDKAIEIDPRHANALQRRAGFSLSGGDHVAAIADLTAAIEQDDNLLSALRLRGISYLITEQPELALADFQSALNSAEGIDNAGKAELWYQVGLANQSMDRHEEAARALSQATNLKKDLAAAHFALSMSQGTLQQFPQARQSLDAAIDADPENAEYLLTRANLSMAEAQYQQEFEQGNPAQTMKSAITDYERAVELTPEDDSAWYALAVAYSASGNDEQAIRKFSQAIQLNPHDASYYQARGDILLTRQQYVAAIEDFTKAIELSPDSQALYESRALAYGELGKRDEALADYDKAEQLAAQSTDPQKGDGGDNN